MMIIFKLSATTYLILTDHLQNINRRKISEKNDAAQIRQAQMKCTVGEIFVQK